MVKFLFITRIGCVHFSNDLLIPDWGLPKPFPCGI